MKIIYAIGILLMAGTVSANAQYAKTPAFVTDSLENYINTGMQDWQIPGLAIAIVKDGKTVFMKGFGVKDVDTREPVNEHTLFMIASNSKLFTGTALAQLEYNKKLSLDDKVTKYFPAFKLYEQTSTELVTIKDMLSHRIGTKTFQGDFTFWNGALSRSQIMAKMKDLKPTGQFRQDYGYCNSCYLTAGEVIPVVTNKPWEVYVYDSILKPLGMNNTHMLSMGIDQRNNVAKPYTTQYFNYLMELPYDNVDNIGPAGSMVSNVSDITKWLKMQLDSGRFEEKRILPWQVLQKTREVNIVTNSRKSSVYPINFRGYGLGLVVNDYNGRQVYSHTGGAFGFVTNTCFVPEENLGITILTNNDNQSFFELLRYQLLDAYLGVPFKNRSKAQLAGHIKEMEKTAEHTASLQKRVTGNNPSLPLDAYTGEYINPVYGKILIEKDNTGKKLNIILKGHNNLSATLEYMDNEEWLLTFSNIGYGIFATNFTIEKGKIASFLLKVNDFIELDPYVFKKL